MSVADNIRIKPDGSARSEMCSHCAGATITVWGYVYKDEAALAAYFARWTENHLERGMQMMVSIGGWSGDKQTPRVGFGIECHMDDGIPGFTLVDAATLPWHGQEPQVLGTPLNRNDALTHDRKEQVFAILDHLIEDDSRIHTFLHQ